MAPQQNRPSSPSPDRPSLRLVCLQVFPVVDDTLFDQMLSEVQDALQSYTELKASADIQLASAYIRKELRNAQRLFSQIETWLNRTQSTVVRDYVLNGISKSPRSPRLIDTPEPDWRTELAKIQLWQSGISEALLLVPTDRGQPENYPLKLLVRRLATIWAERGRRPFTNTKKGQYRPRDFAIAVCQWADSALAEAQIEVAIRFVVSKMPGPRRGRKSTSPPAD